MAGRNAAGQNDASVRIGIPCTLLTSTSASNSKSKSQVYSASAEHALAKDIAETNVSPSQLQAILNEHMVEEYNSFSRQAARMMVQWPGELSEECIQNRMVAKSHGFVRLQEKRMADLVPVDDIFVRIPGPKSVPFQAHKSSWAEVLADQRKQKDDFLLRKGTQWPAKASEDAEPEPEYSASCVGLHQCHQVH